MFNKKFKFTKEELNQMFLDAFMDKEPGQGATARPNFLESLKAKAGLSRIRNERKGS